MATRDAPEDGFFAAGAPWYLTLFGRDSIWTARMLLPVDLEPARGTLRTLARRQGSRVDLRSAEEPGKILHELRRTTVHLGSTWFPPVYYGTIDATPLWICLLHDAWQAGLPSEEVAELLPALELALKWLIECGDAMATASWSITTEAGTAWSTKAGRTQPTRCAFTTAAPPTDLWRCAKCRVMRTRLPGEAPICSTRSAAQAPRTTDPGHPSSPSDSELSFWCGPGDDRYPALALDGAKHQVDSLSSNIGHLLGTGILNADEELLIARRVASPALDSGLGLRTMAATDAGYAPLSYHCGSVWPHDTAIVIAGLVRAGWLSMPVGSSRVCCALRLPSNNGCQSFGVAKAGQFPTRLRAGRKRGPQPQRLSLPTHSGVL